MIKILKKDKKTGSRVGEFYTRKGVVKTPVFMPIATKGAVKSLAPKELEDLGTQIILGNTYHLWLRPGMEIIKKAGGLHKFMNWPGPILTDSGGYQVFSLGEKIRLALCRKKTPSTEHSNINYVTGCGSCLAASSDKKQQNLGDGCDTFFSTKSFARDDQYFLLDGLPRTGEGSVKISDEGVEFRDPINGDKYFLTPEKSIEIQLALGSDIIMVLDECPPYPAGHEKVALAAKRTTEWAWRCKKYFEKKTKNIKKEKRPLLFGIVQGGIYKDLRERSAKELLVIGFDGYAIGGVAVGEPRKYLATVLEAVMPLLPEDKPRYLMGLGKPEEIVAAVNIGIDMFDCVIPTREARHGKLYKFKTLATGKVLAGKQNPKLFYETINILNSRFTKDFQPIDKKCSCYTCQNYTRAYLHHLFKVGEPLSLCLATIHNLKFYLGLTEFLRI